MVSFQCEVNEGSAARRQGRAEARGRRRRTAAVRTVRRPRRTRPAQLRHLFRRVADGADIHDSAERRVEYVAAGGDHLALLQAILHAFGLRRRQAQGGAVVAPTIVGGDEAATAVGGRGAETMSDALRLERTKVRRFGRDTAIIGYC